MDKKPSKGQNLGPTQRCLKVGEEVRRVLASVFQNYFFEDSAVSTTSITITEVQMSPDLGHAKVFLIPLGGVSKGLVLETVRAHSSRIRHLLGKKVQLRHVPALDFRIDETFDAFAAINNALK
jgi:ribosome-binding factor A